jgi:DeoR/GlpR family transcriptional regulator of sugar metabolism
VRGPQVSFEPTLDETSQLHVAEKESIGRLAASLIKSGDTIMMDGGSTTSQVVKNISGSNITVVTNSLHLVWTLMSKPEVEVVIVGGILRRHAGTTIGAMTEKELSGLAADKAIIGINAISPDRGLSTPNSFAAEIKASMVRQSREVIVVADHTKFGNLALYQAASIDLIDKIVTDSAVTPDQILPFVEAGVEVLVAQ